MLLDVFETFAVQVIESGEVATVSRLKAPKGKWTPTVIKGGVDNNEP
jgi:hypothetical protein